MKILAHTYTALLGWSLTGYAQVVYIRKQGQKRNFDAKTWPAEVRSYLCLDTPEKPHQAHISRDSFLELEAKDEILRVGKPNNITRILTFTVPAPVPPTPQYILDAQKELDPLECSSWSVGNEDWTAYFDAVRVKNRIVYVVAVDCESGSFVETTESGNIPVSEASTLVNFPELYADICREHYADSRKREHRVKVRETARAAQAWKQHIESLVQEQA